jgi:hypothetical protein
MKFSEIDWSELDAFGPIEEVPRLLAEMEESPSQEVMTELWEILLHQGTVSSASLAVLPEIARIANNCLLPEMRCSLSVLAASILQGFNEEHLCRPRETAEVRKQKRVAAEEFRFSNSELYSSERKLLLQIAEETMASQQYSKKDAHYLLGAMVCFYGAADVWSYMLNYALYYLECSCNAYLELYFSDGELVWMQKDGEKITQSLILGRSEELTGISLWVYHKANQYNLIDIARWPLFWVGTNSCPQCGTNFKISERCIEDY